MVQGAKTTTWQGRTLVSCPFSRCLRQKPVSLHVRNLERSTAAAGESARAAIAAMQIRRIGIEWAD
jgi:hypothetical protein